MNLAMVNVRARDKHFLQLGYERRLVSQGLDGPYGPFRRLSLVMKGAMGNASLCQVV